MFILPLEELVSRAVAGAVPHGRFCWIPPGGRVHLVCRDHSRAEGARAEIIRESGNQVSGPGPLLRGFLPAGRGSAGRDSWPGSCSRAGRALFRLLLGRRPQPTEELQPRFSRAGLDPGGGGGDPHSPGEGLPGRRDTDGALPGSLPREGGRVAEACPG